MSGVVGLPPNRAVEADVPQAARASWRTLGRKKIRMLTAIANSRPGSRLRLLTLLAAAHASVALSLWLCAFDVNLLRIT